jgi:hypothetical protein
VSTKNNDIDSIEQQLEGYFKLKVQSVEVPEMPTFLKTDRNRAHRGGILVMLSSAAMFAFFLVNGLNHQLSEGITTTSEKFEVVEILSNSLENINHSFVVFKGGEL